MALGMELDYRLRWMDFDRHGRIQPAALLDIFQDLATVQAEDMGIGRDDMLEKGVFWAVVRSRYEIVREPRHYQVVTARTWPHSPTRFSFMRDFSLRDEAGELLVKATTEWVLMDAQTRKFASVLDYYDGPHDFDAARAFEAKPRKIANFEEGAQPACTIVPGYSDIDVNGHVNNAMYANYVVNALDPSLAGAIKAFQLDYRYEVLPDVPLSMHVRMEDGLARVKGVNPDGNIAFAAAIEWR